VSGEAGAAHGFVTPPQPPTSRVEPAPHGESPWADSSPRIVGSALRVVVVRASPARSGFTAASEPVWAPTRPPAPRHFRLVSQEGQTSPLPVPRPRGASGVRIVAARCRDVLLAVGRCSGNRVVSGDELVAPRIGVASERLPPGLRRSRAQQGGFRCCSPVTTRAVMHSWHSGDPTGYEPPRRDRWERMRRRVACRVRGHVLGGPVAVQGLEVRVCTRCGRILATPSF
jgi:hypothetical protein